jgi:hypothetical protein
MSNFFVLKIFPKFKGQCKSDADCCNGVCGLGYPDRDGTCFFCYISGQTTNGACRPPPSKDSCHPHCECSSFLVQNARKNSKSMKRKLRNKSVD